MKPNDAQKKWLGKTAQRYHEALTPEVITYLADRGLDQDAVRGYLLGLVSDPDPLHEEYRGRLSIPYLTPTGVVTMRFRCLADHSCKDAKCAKYIQPKDEPTHIYNVQALHDADTEVGVCEGELDAIAATVAGFPSIGIPGATNWKAFWYRLFDDFERVVVMGDGDTAGRTFTTRLVHAMSNGEAKVMPPALDVNSYIQEYGQESFLVFVNQ